MVDVMMAINISFRAPPGIQNCRIVKWGIRDCRSASCSEKAGYVGGQEKESGRSQSFRHQRRPVDDCSPGRRRMAHDGAEQGAEYFMTKWIAAAKARAGLRHAVVCPKVTGRTNKERITQSKRTRAGPLAIVD